MDTSPFFVSTLFPSCPLPLLLGGLIDRLGQPALLPGRGVAVNQVLPAGAIEQLDGVMVRGFRRVTGRRPDLLQGRPELAPLLAIVGGGPLGLTHPLLG